MAEVDIVNKDNKKVGTATLSPDIFGAPVREHLVQKYVVMQQGKKRRGTAATKQSMSELRGGGIKPWRQKGTGRARAGSSRSALWRGGLTTFGPSPRSFEIKMSKKAKKLALKSVLTERALSNCIQVVESLALSEPKTKHALELLKALELPEKTLFIVAEKDKNLELAVRNLPRTDVLPVEGMNVFDLLMHEKIVCTPEAIKKIEERLN